MESLHTNISIEMNFPLKYERTIIKKYLLRFYQKNYVMRASLSFFLLNLGVCFYYP